MEHQIIPENKLKIGTFINKTTEHASFTFQQYFCLFIQLW